MLELLQKGGLFMWPIVLCSVVAVAIAVERWLVFRKLPNSHTKLVAELIDMLRGGHASKAEAHSKKQPGPVAAVLSELLGARDLSSDEREQIVGVAGSRELRRLETRLRGLSAIARVAPLLGLLGTVAGLVAAFMAVGERGGQVDAGVLASGIWQALLTTIAGLVVAIPAMLAGDWFESRVDEVEFTIREAATQLMTARTNDGGHGQEDSDDPADAQETDTAVTGAHATH